MAYANARGCISSSASRARSSLSRASARMPSPGASATAVPSPHMARPAVQPHACLRSGTRYHVWHETIPQTCPLQVRWSAYPHEHVLIVLLHTIDTRGPHHMIGRHVTAVKGPEGIEHPVKLAPQCVKLREGSPGRRQGVRAPLNNRHTSTKNPCIRCQGRSSLFAGSSYAVRTARYR